MKSVVCLVLVTSSVLVFGCGSQPIHKNPHINPTTPHPITKLSQAEITNITRARAASAAMGDYALAHHDLLPKASHWEEAIRPYWEKDIPFSVALFAPQGQRPHRLAMNKQLSGVYTTKIERYDATVMLYEAISNHKNANGDPASVPIRDPEDGHLTIRCFADGRPNFFDQRWVAPH